MIPRDQLQSEQGIALVVVLLVGVAVAAITLGAGMLSTSTSAISVYSERLSVLEAVAEAGLEEGRSAINGDGALYPDSGFTVLEDDVPVDDVDGQPVPNVRRYTYVGPTGVTTGQYGVFGSIVVVVEDDFGNKIVRRNEVSQESFAKYAYFTESEGANIYFGGGDQIFGPVHSNDQLQIHNTGATFHGSVETAQDIQDPQFATFMQGYTEFGRYIGLPETADLLKLQTQAEAGNTAFVGNAAGGDGQATTRIEFMAIDVNGDGDVSDDNEGFARVYQHLADPGWVMADVPADYNANGLRNSRNCGWYEDDDEDEEFEVAADLDDDEWEDALAGSTRRCFLGGADPLWNGFVAADAQGGQWLTWPGAVDPAVQAARPDDAAYLFPINREFNPSFKGVIYVQGKVAISGVLRGRVTVAATDDIIVADDITYSVDPGAGTCTDILGVFGGEDVFVADNTLNNPTQRKAPGSVDNPYLTYDETKDEFIHGVVLALGSFTVENYDAGSLNAEACEATAWGRGCLYLAGGVIQDTRGAVGLATGLGHLKRYAYDQCAAAEPPPYFPTTGHFARGRFFEVDPVNFDVENYFRLLTPF
jgi:hypothetical protein